MLPPFDPESIPVRARDVALPAIERSRLSPEALRARFALPPRWTPEVFRDARTAPAPTRAASVLIGLAERGDAGLQLLLTRRNARLQVHAGQISFPGGSRDPGDVDPVQTALREAREEIGLDPAHVETLGTMPVYTTITGFAVTPVVALVAPDALLRADPGEVAELFEVPFEFLMDPANHEHRSWNPENGEPAGEATPRRSFYAMPWTSTLGQRYFIWGATAAMIRNLYRLLSA
jgi:8-oxo-dGTP pyrophosphatase MutT (NUDIX family)